MPPGQTAALPRGFETSFCLASCPLITHAVNGLDVGCAAVGFNLAANTADGGCQGVFVHKLFVHIPIVLFPKAAHGSALAGDLRNRFSICTHRDRVRACRLRKPSAPRSPETTARRRKCPLAGLWCSPAWRTWL